MGAARRHPEAEEDVRPAEESHENERSVEMRLMFKLFALLSSVEFLGAIAAIVLAAIWLSK